MTVVIVTSPDPTADTTPGRDDTEALAAGA